MDLKERFLINYKKFEIGGNNYDQYNRQINRLYKYMQEKKSYSNEIDLLTDINYDVAEDYAIYLSTNGNYKKSTINTIIAVTKEYFNYLTKKRHMFDYNPFDVVEQYSASEVEADRKRKESLTVEEMKKILANVDNSIKSRKKDTQDFLIKRDKFLFALMFTNGSRITETLKIKMSWIERDKKNGYVIQVPANVVKNKMNKALVIPKSVEKMFNDYMFERRCLSKKFDSDLLFVSINGNEINRRNAIDIVKRACVSCNIEKNITPHSFRGSCLLQLEQKQIDEGLRRKILGWKNNSIEDHYTAEANNPIYNDLKMKACDLLG